MHIENNSPNLIFWGQKIKKLSVITSFVIFFLLLFLAIFSTLVTAAESCFYCSEFISSGNFFLQSVESQKIWEKKKIFTMLRVAETPAHDGELL